MKNLILITKLLLITLLSTNSFYMLAGENDSASFKRNLWFYNQRYAPDDTISEAFMQNALSERFAIESSGYFLNPMSNSWICLGGITGRINFVKYTNDNRVIIGGPNAGLWIYSSQGWQSMDPNHELTSNVSGAIAIDYYTNPPTIYYGTGEGRYGYVYSYLGDGIFKTTNWGNNWTSISNGLASDLKIFRITIRPGEENHEQIFAATSNGLYRSDNAGDDWELVSGTSGLNCNDIQFSHQGEYTKAFITGPKPSHETIKGVGFRLSTDGGINFTAYTGDDLQPNGRTHIAICESDDNYIYIITDNGDITSYTSTNGGVSFSYGPVNTNTSAQGGHNMFIEVPPNEPNVAFIGGVKMKKTTDYGANYISGSWGSLHDDFHDLDINPNNSSEYVVVNDGGIYKSTNSGTDWEYHANWWEIPFMNSYRVCSGVKIFAGVTDRGFAEKTAITAFKDSFIPFLDGTSIISLKSNPNIILGITGASEGGVIYRSTDGGQTEANRVTLPGVWDGGNDWIGILTEHPDDAGHIYTARRNSSRTAIDIYRTTNYGANWITSPVFGSAPGTRSPQNLVFSEKDPNIVYLSTSGYDGPNWYTQVFKRALYKSTDGGEHWLEPLVLENDIQTIPNLYISRVVTAPSTISTNPDEVYLTFSGFYTGSNLGHVLRSTDEGNSWENISGNLPDSPVNDLVWWNSDCGITQKTLAVATDVGVFSSTNEGSSWQLLASDLPLAPVLDLEYARYNKSLIASTFGRGVWQVELDGDVYIKENTVMPSHTTLSKNIVICDGGVLNVNDALLTINDNKQIIIKSGGKLVGGTDAAFYSLNTWNGIIVEPGGELNLNGCYFDQTSTPITIEGNSFASSPNTTIENCNFLNNDEIGTIYINNRDNVTVSSCAWLYPGSYSNLENAIVSVNSNNVLIDNNDFNIASNAQNIDFSAIFIDYGTDIVVSNNQIKKMALGITISNASPFIYRNTIESASNSSNTMCGLTLTNSYSGNIKQNTILDFETGVKLVNSSPLLFENTIVNDISHSNAVECLSVSSPRLRPQEINGATFWDAGKNTLSASTNGGFGISMYYYSIPELDYGCNQFNTASYSIEGNIASGLAGNYYLFARNNSWNSFTQNVFDAYFDEGNPTCSPGEGGSEREKEDVPPPQPIVVNYGNGIYDTIQVTTRNIQVNSDQALYLSANNDEITGNYQSAITKYEQVIQNYQDSLSAINSLRKLLHCKDKMNGDTNAYSQLRGYYQAKVQANLTDTAFVNVAEELAAKCLVRMGHPTNAIDEYEVIISNTNDSAKILCAELNIIETYLIIQNSGDSPNYTGQLGYLKPMGKEDAYKKIMDRLHKGKNKKPVNQLPKEYQLSQNYPNPFNPVTKIKYALPYASNVTLKVYDILGREVISLVNEFKAAGSYIVEFNGKNYASGVYFYRIEAEGQNGRKYVERKKMVLVK